VAEERDSNRPWYAWSVDAAGGRTPKRIIGRYAFFDQIASGGMATVHLGRLCGPAGFAPTVAIKCLHSSFRQDPAFVEMFLDEARLAARVRHPNVVPVFDVVSMGEEVFLVMEYVHGEALSRLLRAASRVQMYAPAPVASAILCGVLHGLHAAHEAKSEQGDALGLVHRDVSPQNILVGVDGIARVLDFGVAKAAGRVQTTRDGQIKGKLAYMAPEQLRGKPVSRQADVYAAAVVLWETLAGRRLFQADSEGSVVEQVLFAEVAPPSTVVPGLAPSLDRVVMRGLARDPDSRFRSAREMAVALQEAVGVASPATVGQWVERWADDAFSAREKIVAEIDASGPVELDRIGSGTRTATSAQPFASLAEPGGSQVSSISVTRPTSTSRPRSAWTMGVAVVIVAAVAVVVSLRTRRGLLAARLGSPGVSVQPTTSAPEGAATGAVSAPPTPTPAVSGTAAAAEPYSVAAGTSASATVLIPKRHAPALPGNCNPPFTRDAEGRKIYKRQCLQ
jgi:serine/threonine protein kinase